MILFYLEEARRDKENDVELGQRLHLVIRTMTALQGMRFQSNYRWNRCKMGTLGGGR